MSCDVKMAGLLKTRQQDFYKLDRVLMEWLNNDEFESIRAQEPCVVCCEKFKGKFMFAVVNRDYLFLLPNETNIKRIELVISLGSVISVKPVSTLECVYERMIVRANSGWMFHCLFFRQQEKRSS